MEAKQPPSGSKRLLNSFKALFEDVCYLNYRTEAPQLLRDFLVYHETIQAHSKRTVEEYFLDLRNFFRYIKLIRGRVPKDSALESIDISDFDLELAASVGLTDVYSYMGFLSGDRGLNAASRARKVAAIRSFYKYLVNKAKVMDVNPVQDLDSPNIRKALPKYLKLDESLALLESVDGPNAIRDYCILTLFLNCGLRISELVGLNKTDVRGDQLRVLGKGNKERILYLNDACQKALDDWMIERDMLSLLDEKALFVTPKYRKRITTAAVHKLVKKHLSAAGLDSSQYSSHKLRHTAATLMLQNGVDVRTLQEVLGHDHLNTTQIYTHVDSDDLRYAAKANPLSKVKKAKKVREALEDAMLPERGETESE